ncbi:MAG: hypothetical protein QOE70_1281 [Chthoniobacter sp.]|jgi:FlaA1/EpsC-like NDP-sugar epimerase|nr:hypothetical protein [Chthoniobacter sp.]
MNGTVMNRGEERALNQPFGAPLASPMVRFSPAPSAQHVALIACRKIVGVRRGAGFRLVTLLLIYTFGLACSLWAAYQLRFDFNVPKEYAGQFLMVIWWSVPLKLLFLFGFRQFSGLLTFFSTPDLGRLLGALMASSGVILVGRLLLGAQIAPPRGIIVVDFALSLLLLSAGRLALRVSRERYGSRTAGATPAARPVGIVGAGEVGANLARELLATRHLGLVPVAFFDDDRRTWRSTLHGIPVIGPPEILLYTDAPPPVMKMTLFHNPLLHLFEAKRPNLRLQEIIIAMPSAPQKRIREVVRVLQKAQLKFQTVPSIDQLATGKVRVTQLRPVEIQDLLGRDQVELETESIRAILADKVVAVTGAGGSIGSELCRQIAGFKPARLLLIEQSEVQMYQVEQALHDFGHGSIIVPCVANVLDAPRMKALFEQHRPQVVFHAAAHKHVPMMESTPGEAIKNNTFGTLRTAELSIKHGVERFVLISTDKAINPTNVMGASKRLAELSMQSLHASQRGSTKFMAVRFGNVLGSSGSVVPAFARQIAAGGPVRVTHPDVTRYFMTVPEAVSLVLQSAMQGEGGEIFVLDMGQPIKIVALAKQMIELSGLKLGEDIEIEFTGLRPGEKLFEELSHGGENIAPTLHPKIMRFVSQPRPLHELEPLLTGLAGQLHTAGADDLKRALRQLIPEYRPQFA